MFFLIFLGVVAANSASLPSISAPEDRRETVVLLHGLGRTRWSMSPLATDLQAAGYRVVNLSYPSRSRPLEELAEDWLPRQLRAQGVEVGPRLHFVTHSMGGIIVRLWLRAQPVTTPIGRVVMLAPPNAGSELTPRLNAFPPFRWFTGVNGRRLGPADTDLPRTLGPWPTEKGSLGVIAGDRSWNPLFSAWLAGPNDGKVSVASTHLAGEAAHVVLHASHTWLGWRRATLDQVRAFLRTGTFISSAAK